MQLLHLSGTPQQRGRQYGREIRDLLLAYWDELVLDVTERSDHPMTEAELKDWVRTRIAPALALAPDLDEEINGIAEGAGIEYELALANNMGEELVHLANSLGWTPPTVQRCLSVIVPPEQSSTGGYILAQTWDGPPWQPDPVLLVIEEEAGKSAFVADPGWVGGAGLNERGLASVHTGVGAKTDGTPGVPYPFIARRILRSADLESASRSVMEHPSTAGCHYILVDDARVVDVETAGATHAAIAYEGPLSTCAHFSDPACAALHSNPRGNLISQFRTQRIMALLMDAIPIDPTDLFGLMSDHQAGPDNASVCLHPGRGRTLGSLVVDLAGGRLFAQPGNPCLSRPITEVALTQTGYVSRISHPVSPTRS